MYRFVGGLKCIGAFIGDDGWTSARLVSTAEAHLKPLDTIARLCDTDRMTNRLQCQLQVMRYCASPACNYWMRLTPPSAFSACPGDNPFDSPIKRVLADILHFDPESTLGSLAMRQAFLPLALGGLGLSSVQMTGRAAFVGSLTAAWADIGDLVPSLKVPLDDRSLDGCPSIQQLRAHYDALVADHACTASLYNHYETCQPDGNGQRPFHPSDHPLRPPSLSAFSEEIPEEGCSYRSRAQHSFTAIANHAAWRVLYRDLCAQGLARDPVRFVSVSQPGATAYLTASPSSNPAFRMDSDQMLVAVQRQLGVPLSCCVEAASANDQVDAFGDIFVNSGVDNDRPEHTSRHNAVLRQWIAGLKRGWPGKGRVRGDVGQRYRRVSPDAKPDAWIWRGGKFGTHILFELKLTSPLSGTGVPRTASAATTALGGTAPGLLTAIDSKYREARQLGHTVVPLIHDVFGAVHHTARQCIGDTSDRTRGWNMRLRDSSVPWSAPTLKPWMQQSISMALHRAVAEQILQGASYESARLDGELGL